MEDVRTQGIISQIDFAPTILDLCRLPIPQGEAPASLDSQDMLLPWAGKSICPQLFGKCDRVNDWAIIENDEDYLGLCMRTFVTDRYKLTLYAGETFGELYDLKKDPYEVFNLWEDPESRAIKTGLMADFMDAYITQDRTLPRRVSPYA